MSQHDENYQDAITAPPESKDAAVIRELRAWLVAREAELTRMRNRADPLHEIYYRDGLEYERLGIRSALAKLDLLQA